MLSGINISSNEGSEQYRFLNIKTMIQFRNIENINLIFKIKNRPQKLINLKHWDTYEKIIHSINVYLLKLNVSQLLKLYTKKHQINFFNDLTTPTINLLNLKK